MSPEMDQNVKFFIPKKKKKKKKEARRSEIELDRLVGRISQKLIAAFQKAHSNKCVD
jgi:hypothetical protein